MQPFIKNNIALCHNGNISNYDIINKKKLNLKTNSDSELLLALFQKELLKYNELSDKIIVSVIKTISKICKGSFSIIMLIKNYGLICFKDPHGIRPLVYGKKENTYLISSESPSLINNDFTIINEIKGGQIVIFKK